MPESVSESAMGLGAGGKMRQQIYPDPYGVETWEEGNYGTVVVYLLNTERYRAVTGQTPPPTPIDAQTYTAYSLPWFDLYDETAGDVAAPDTLAGIKSIGEQRAEVKPAQVRKPQRKRRGGQEQ
jgi:hypothetical protein